MDKRERQNRIIELIQSNNQTSASKLAQTLNVSKRTILRDMADLENQGVKIVAKQGVRGGYQITETHNQYTMNFTEDQMIALFLTLNESQSYSTLPFKENIKAIIKKCLNIPYTKLRNTLKRLDNYIKFEDHDEALLPQFFTDILIYSAERNVMVVEHTTSDHDVHTENVIFIGMLCQHGTWYAIIFEIGTGQTTMLPVSEIQDIAYSFQKTIQTHDITMHNFESFLKEVE